MDYSGKVINGTYKLLAPLHRMGSIEVYLGRSLNTGEVIDVRLLDDQSTREDRDNFLAEAESMSALHDRHIVSAEDFGQSEGLVFTVTEHLSGLSLATLLEVSGSIPIGIAFGVTSQIVNAVKTLSAEGLTHRDIKPRVIALTRDGVVKIIRLDAARSKRSQLATQSGHSASSDAAFLAPEQLMGQADLRSDIYSIGALLYTMLSGQPPFAASDPIELAFAVHKATPALLSGLNPEVSGTVDEFVASCMAKDPMDRPQTLAALLIAINAITSVASATEAGVAAYVGEVAQQISTRRTAGSGAGAKLRTAYLRSSTGRRLMVRGTRIDVGRQDIDRGIRPTIDLSPFDGQHTVSREHARVTDRDGAWYLTEMPDVGNGTYVNGQRLRPGADVRVSHGDTLKFANVEMIFEEN